MAYSRIGSYNSEIVTTTLADGTTTDKIVAREDFMVDSSDDLISLPSCLPGSRAVNGQYIKDCTDAAAYIAVKLHNGSWL